MRWALGSSLRFWRLVVALAILLMVFGVGQLRSAPVDAYPDFMPPSVEVQTEALGLSAVEVEQLITVPLEQDLLNGVPWLDRIRSASMPGLSVIDLTFEQGTNLYSARQLVQERMTQAHALPNVGSPPVMIQPLASASRVAMIGLSEALIPTFVPPASPRLSSRAMTRTSGKSRARRASESSLEPLSTRIVSKSRQVCPRNDARQVGRRWAPFQLTTTTAISGISEGRRWPRRLYGAWVAWQRQSHQKAPPPRTGEGLGRG